MNRLATIGVVTFSCLVFAGLSDNDRLSAQQPPSAQAQASQAQAAPARAPRGPASPASKALSEAANIKDADQRSKAIRKVIRDYPDSAGRANTMLLDALIKKGDAKAVRKQAQAMVTAAGETSKSRTRRDVAGALLRGDFLLEDAETYGKAAVESLDQQRYVEARKKAAAASASAARASSEGTSAADGSAEAPAAAEPDDDEFITAFKTEKQSALLTLGQILAKRGKDAEAERALRDAYLLDRNSATAATAALKLAGFAKAAGRDGDRFDYLAAVALAGRLTTEADGDLQAVYMKLHGGSLDGLEDALDALYEKEGPRPPEVKPYARAADGSDRLVLAEIFTGSGCPPCVAADLAFEGAMHRYGQAELAVLMYHLHIPRPDPMTNPFTQARAKFYSARSVPTFVIDGNARTGGGSAARAGAIYRERVESVIDKRLSVMPGVRLALTGRSTGGVVRASISVAPGEATARRLRLQLALVEEQVRYSGENGIRFHPMVVRAMAAESFEAPQPPAAPAPATSPASLAPAAKPASPEPAKESGAPAAAASALPVPVLGFAVAPGTAKTVDYSFDLAKVAADGLANLEDLEKHSTRFPNYTFRQKKHQLDPSKLSLVAFVQDEETKEILQAVKVELGDRK
jgi:thiol-disulfide isomerase/thioredoxin